MFMIKNFVKDFEVDNYLKGCDPATASSMLIDITLQAETIEELITKCEAFFGGEADRDGGQISICIHETNDSQKLTSSQLELWREGKFKAWLCTYTGHMQETKYL
jgi:hypothetical protein